MLLLTLVYGGDLGHTFRVVDMRERVGFQLHVCALGRMRRSSSQPYHSLPRMPNLGGEQQEKRQPHESEQYSGRKPLAKPSSKKESLLAIRSGGNIAGLVRLGAAPLALLTREAEACWGNSPTAANLMLIPMRADAVERSAGVGEGLRSMCSG